MNNNPNKMKGLEGGSGEIRIATFIHSHKEMSLFMLELTQHTQRHQLHLSVTYFQAVSIIQIVIVRYKYPITPLFGFYNVLKMNMYLASLVMFVHTYSSHLQAYIYSLSFFFL